MKNSIRSTASAYALLTAVAIFSSLSAENEGDETEGTTPAHYKIASEYYANGDLQEAFKLYKSAAKNGHSGAQFKIAMMLCQGEGVPENVTKSLKWLERASANGSLEAQQLLSGAYFNVANKYYEAGEFLHAFTCYKMAAKNNNVEAQFKAGVMQLNAEGIPGNKKKALKRLKKAAEGRHPDAQLFIDESYSTETHKSYEYDQTQHNLVWTLYIEEEPASTVKFYTMLYRFITEHNLKNTYKYHQTQHNLVWTLYIEEEPASAVKLYTMLYRFITQRNLKNTYKYHQTQHNFVWNYSVEEEPVSTVKKTQVMDQTTVDNAGYLGWLPVEVLTNGILGRLGIYELRALFLSGKYLKAYTKKYYERPAFAKYLASKNEEISKYPILRRILWGNTPAEALLSEDYTPPVKKLPLMEAVCGLMNKGIPLNDIENLIKSLKIEEAYQLEDNQLLKKQIILLSFADQMLFQENNSGKGWQNDWRLLFVFEKPQDVFDDLLKGTVEQVEAICRHAQLFELMGIYKIWTNETIAELLKYEPALIESVGQFLSRLRSQESAFDAKQIIKILLKGTKKQIEAIGTHAPSIFSGILFEHERNEIIAALFKGTPEQIEGIGKHTSNILSGLWGHQRKEIISALIEGAPEQIEAVGTHAPSILSGIDFYNGSKDVIAALLKGTPAQIEAISRHHQLFELMNLFGRREEATIKELLKYEPALIDSVGKYAQEILTKKSGGSECQETFDDLLKGTPAQIEAIGKHAFAFFPNQMDNAIRKPILMKLLSLTPEKIQILALKMVQFNENNHLEPGNVFMLFMKLLQHTMKDGDEKGEKENFSHIKEDIAEAIERIFRPLPANFSPAHFAFEDVNPDLSQPFSILSNEIMEHWMSYLDAPSFMSAQSVSKLWRAIGLGALERHIKPQHLGFVADNFAQFFVMNPHNLLWAHQILSKSAPLYATPNSSWDPAQMPIVTTDKDHVPHIIRQFAKMIEKTPECYPFLCRIYLNNIDIFDIHKAYLAAYVINQVPVLATLLKEFTNSISFKPEEFPILAKNFENHSRLHHYLMTLKLLALSGDVGSTSDLSSMAQSTSNFLSNPHGFAYCDGESRKHLVRHPFWGAYFHEFNVLSEQWRAIYDLSCVKSRFRPSQLKAFWELTQTVNPDALSNFATVPLVKYDIEGHDDYIFHQLSLSTISPSPMNVFFNHLPPINVFSNSALPIDRVSEYMRLGHHKFALYLLEELRHRLHNTPADTALVSHHREIGYGMALYNYKIGSEVFPEAQGLLEEWFKRNSLGAPQANPHQRMMRAEALVALMGIYHTKQDHMSLTKMLGKVSSDELKFFVQDDPHAFRPLEQIYEDDNYSLAVLILDEAHKRFKKTPFALKVKLELAHSLLAAQQKSRFSEAEEYIKAVFKHFEDKGWSGADAVERSDSEDENEFLNNERYSMPHVFDNFGMPTGVGINVSFIQNCMPYRNEYHGVQEVPNFYPSVPEGFMSNPSISRPFIMGTHGEIIFPYDDLDEGEYFFDGEEFDEGEFAEDERLEGNRNLKPAARKDFSPLTNLDYETAQDALNALHIYHGQFEKIKNLEPGLCIIKALETQVNNPKLTDSFLLTFGKKAFPALFDSQVNWKEKLQKHGGENARFLLDESRDFPWFFKGAIQRGLLDPLHYNKVIEFCLAFKISGDEKLLDPRDFKDEADGEKEKEI